MTRGMLAFTRFAEMRGRPGKFLFRYSRIAFIIQTYFCLSIDFLKKKFICIKVGFCLKSGWLRGWGDGFGGDVGN